MATVTLDADGTDWRQAIQSHIAQLNSQQAVKTEYIRDFLSAGGELLDRAFYNDADITQLLHHRAALIDAAICALWKAHRIKNSAALTIIAVGGYGRREMHPYSDVDLLILMQDLPDDADKDALSDFITSLWDLKLEIGHSVRTLEECVEEAIQDLTVITNLIESRMLCGNKQLFQRLQSSITPDKIWSSQQFFQAKLGEQQDRYGRFGDTAYRVEPNLKNGPGGLRDLQMISWVTKREYNNLSLKELSEKQLLTEREYHTLIDNRDFLWRVRYAVHLLAKRKEDRLLLGHQRKLAEIFSYGVDEDSNEPVEKFMHDYYFIITDMERLSELLLGIFREQILDFHENGQTRQINEWCAQKGKYLGITNPHIFVEQPHTLLEIFNLLQTSTGVKGLTPSTIRSIHSHLHMIDDDYRAQPRHKEIFMQILSEPSNITHILRHMNRHGVLAAWIPAFANIVGRMQFDLFHAYTVDDHTLRVINMLRRNSVPKGTGEMPFEGLIFKSLPDPKLLYLAGLFHDIAKGRGGDHSELGAKDAYRFCISNGLNSYDSHLVSWLVENHLILSMTAQRKDISDPEVIMDFARKMGDWIRLDYLYLLTIADIRGTNAELWNGWKHSLMRELYRNTRKVLKHNLPPDSFAKIVRQKQDAILEQLPSENISKEQGQGFCLRMGVDYLLYHSVESILWQMSLILSETVYPLIQLRKDKHRNTTTLFVYSKGDNELFAYTTAVLGKMQINIVSAFMMRTPKGYSLLTLHILEDDKQPLSDPGNQQILLRTLRQEITDPGPMAKAPVKKIPARLKAFKVITQVSFTQDVERGQTKLWIRTKEIPGLLGILSRVFLELEVHIVNARISTLGEEVEDMFFITNDKGEPVTDDEKLHAIHERICSTIETFDC